MFKLKKFFATVLSALLCAPMFMGGVRAEETWKLFVEDLKNIFYERRFVFDEENRNRLTNDLDSSLPLEVVADSTAHRKAYHDAVENILQRGGQVRYNCRVLAAWAYCKLRDLGVNCKEITILSNNPRGGVYQHAAVLIPSNGYGAKKWYICDISDMSQTGNGMFAAVELGEYIAAHKGDYIGMVVNDDEYKSFDIFARSPKLGGRDIAAWLATDADDSDSALRVLESQKTGQIKFMSGEDVVSMDGDIIRNLILFSNSRGLADRLINYGISGAKAQF